MINIGKIIIDDTLYPGTDLYSDGPIEDEMLEIAQNYGEEEYNRIITERQSWPILYHFSNVRENIIEGLDISKKHEVLEIGAGCGAITGVLARKAKHVDAIELSLKRTKINAYRHKNFDNIKISVGNFQDIEKSIKKKYDFITLIGVLEYAQGYISENNPYESFLSKIKEHLTDDGKLIIAIENKFGLKYWAGCREDHTGKMFEGIEGYASASKVRTFGKNELIKILTDAGFNEWEFYYPYPDYKFPTDIYSDKYLPSKGTLSNNMRNYDQPRMELFDETLAYDELIKNDMFPFFSNSFLIVCG